MTRIGEYDKKEDIALDETFTLEFTLEENQEFVGYYEDRYFTKLISNNINYIFSGAELHSDVSICIRVNNL